jgi:hypothetical protein
MFRHPATVLTLDGRDCAFRSKSQPGQDGSILLEFDYRQADPNRRVSQGRVKSNHAEGESGFYRVVVELEIAQTAKVFPEDADAQTTVREVPLPLVPANTAGSAENKSGPVTAPREFPSPSKSSSIPQVVTRAPNQDAGDTIRSEPRDLLTKSRVEDTIAMREAVKSAVTFEIKQEISLLKNWISSELERVLPGIVSSKMETMIRETLEKQASVNYKTSIEDLNIDVARQIADRITESKDLSTGLESMARKLFAEQTELSRTAGIKVEQELSSRVAAIIMSFEESIAEMEARTSAARGDMEAVLTKPHSLKQEINDSMLALREAVEQLKDAQRAGEENFQNQVAVQLNTCAAQFENQLHKISMERAELFSMETEESIAEMEARSSAARGDMQVVLTKSQNLKQEISDGILALQEALQQLKDAERAGEENIRNQVAAQLTASSAQFESQLNKISTERADQFSMETEKHLAPHQQRASELIENLGAVLQLLQRTARVQQEQLTDHSQTTAARFEKEIRALFLRLAGSAHAGDAGKENRDDT